MKYLDGINRKKDHTTDDFVRRRQQSDVDLLDDFSGYGRDLDGGEFGGLLSDRSRGSNSERVRRLIDTDNLRNFDYNRTSTKDRG